MRFLLYQLIAIAEMTPTSSAAVSKGKICGLRILSHREAAAEGFVTITTDICSKNEMKILASIARDRDPERAVFIATMPHKFQLAVPRADVSDLADRTTGGVKENESSAGDPAS